jgi:predicted DNA binding protein
MLNETEDDFLAGLDNGSSDPFTPQDNDDIFPEDTKEETVVTTDVKPVPFAKDEKIQRYIERTVEKRLKDFKPSAQETFVKEVSDGGDEKIVNALTKLVGNDTEEKRAILNELKSAFGDLKGQAKQEAIKEFLTSQEESQQAQQQELTEAFDEIEDGFEDIENHYNIELTDRQRKAFKEFLIKVEPRGGYDEYPDFVETFEVFRNYVKANRPSNAQAKQLASRGMERSSTNTETSSVPKREGTKSLWQMLGQ